MIEVRPFSTLGGGNHGWLDAKHHFSFADYRDPERVHWGALRVWNDDRIAPHTGFAPHPHNDMEIITYVRSGAITHKDSLGNEGRTEAGDVQVMSAGTGIVHSEKNEEDVETTLFQIWIIPDRQGEKPGWGARPFPRGDRAGQFVTLASGIDGDGDALPIRADARVIGATLKAGETATHAIGIQCASAIRRGAGSSARVSAPTAARAATYNSTAPRTSITGAEGFTFSETQTMSAAECAGKPPTCKERPASATC